MNRVADPQRLAALLATGLLDSPPEPRFDRLTRLAAAALRAPVALISLVESERQFFKSAYGLAEPWATCRETPLSHSFCQLVVETAAPLLVEDARRDPRLCDNLAIRDLDVIAYLGMPLAHANGTVIGSFCTIDTVPRAWSDQDVALLRDLSVLVQNEIADLRINDVLRTQTRELRKARDAAEAARRAEDRFLAMISHELRTPLNGVIGLAGLLLDSALDPQARLHAKMLREAGDHLLELINDLLDFTKLDADRLEFEEMPYAVDSVVQSALDLLAPRAHGKGLELGAFLAPDVPAMLVGDAGRLRQILLNLLGNAVKFTEHGSVTLEVSFRRRAGELCELDFAVTDTGPGIRPEDQPRLFQEFSQIGPDAQRSAGGTGLGLAICRRLVRRMGGDIAVHSIPGQGSIFRFSIRQPVAVPPPGVEPRAPARLRGEKVLVLHANAVGAALLARQIESRGGAVQRSVLGAAALRLLRAAQEDGAPFHACVVDHGLPGAGAEIFARAVRAVPALAATRLVLIGATDFGPQNAAQMDALFDARLLKPVPPDTLMYRILSGRGQNAAEGGSAAPAFGGAGSLRILVAEDNKTNQAVIRGLLGKLGHRVDVAGNGLEAVQAVRERPYDMLLMDMMMPELDGIAATRRIRALPAPAGCVPILALTADAFTQNHAQYVEAGMQGVLTKPITLQALRSALQPYCEKQAQAG